MAAYRYSQSEKYESSSDSPVDRSGRRQIRPAESFLASRFSQMTIAQAGRSRTRIEEDYEVSTYESSDDSDTDVEISDGPVGRSHAYQSQPSASSRPRQNRHLGREQWVRNLYATFRQQGYSPDQAVTRLATSLVQENYTRTDAEADVRELLQPELATSGQGRATTVPRGQRSPTSASATRSVDEQLTRRQSLQAAFSALCQRGLSHQQAVDRLVAHLVQQGYSRSNAEASVGEVLQPAATWLSPRLPAIATQGHGSPPTTTSSPGTDEQSARRRATWAAYAALCQQGNSPQQAVDSLVTRLIQQGHTRSGAETYVRETLRPDSSDSSLGQVTTAPQGHYISPPAHYNTQDNSQTTYRPSVGSSQGYANGSGDSSSAGNQTATGSQESASHHYGGGGSGSLGGPGGGGGGPPPPLGSRQIPCFIDGCNGRDPTLSELLRGLKTHHDFHFCKKCCLKFDSKQDHAEHKYSCIPCCIAIHRSEPGQLFQPSRNDQRHKQGPACPDWHQVPVPDRWEYLCYLQYPNRPTKTFTYVYGARQPHGNGKVRPNRRKLATAQISSIADDLRGEIKEVKLQLSKTQEELKISRAVLKSSQQTIAKLRSQLKSSDEKVTELQAEEKSSQETITKLQSELQMANSGHIWRLKNIIRQFLILQGLAPLNESLESSIRENAPELLGEQYNDPTVLQNVDQFINPAVLAKLD